MANPINVKEVPQFCEEGNNCDGYTAASLFCVDCDTFQCENCCTLLHIPKGQEQHRRIELTEMPCGQFCEGKHKATTHCIHCAKAMCVVCDRRMHTAKRGGHQRFTFSHIHTGSDRNRVSAGEGDTEDLFSSAVGHGRVGSSSSATEHLGAGMEELQLCPAVKLINNKEELTVSATYTE